MERPDNDSSLTVLVRPRGVVTDDEDKKLTNLEPYGVQRPCSTLVTNPVKIMGTRPPRCAGDIESDSLEVSWT